MSTLKRSLSEVDNVEEDQRELKKIKVDVDVETAAGEEDKDEAELPLDPLENPNVNIDPKTGLKVYMGPPIRIRDIAPKTEERQGVLEWKYVHNTGKRDELRMLVGLKDVIARQLPNMPKDYITRLVLDLNHKSVIGLRNGNVIGGITFKCCSFPGKVKFIEIVFCAITAQQQVKGYGSRLMSYMKVWAQREGYEHMLTYADDYAIGYFQRQGFTLELELERKHWDIGFLKHYDSATLMHCQVDKRVDYLEISEQLRNQRVAFVKKMCELTSSHLIYPGVQDFKTKEPPPGGVLRLDMETLPGLQEAGWDAEMFNQLLSSESQRKVQTVNRRLYDLIIADREIIWPFTAPVQELFPDDAEKYAETITDPIDMRTIREKLDRGFYITHQMLLADLTRLVDNCKTYNPKDSPFYQFADTIYTKYLKTPRGEG